MATSENPFGSRKGGLEPTSYIIGKARFLRRRKRVLRQQKKLAKLGVTVNNAPDRAPKNVKAPKKNLFTRAKQWITRRVNQLG